ncbi:SUMO-activating enzyme subunit 2 [Portunus trituberculatus]|uniref:SUMO-activating enzyme subunit 2 n=1 Tax=Portunus trituberculatus TaxID=210409 RepID=A0A5B7I1A2_PORTR|nr:SUMO-activating enzyme subunit 2 [Portunus trituberculatus]
MDLASGVAVKLWKTKKLFSKLFSEDILYLLSMEKLWENRRRPTPLTWEGAGTMVIACVSGSPFSGIRNYLELLPSVFKPTARMISRSR